MADDEITVEVVFALRERQQLVSLTIAADATVADAIERCGLAASFPDQDLTGAPVAIWGNPASRDQRLCDGDRVEILRPLEIDPREARRQLAAAGRFMGGAGRSTGRRR